MWFWKYNAYNYFIYLFLILFDCQCNFLGVNFLKLTPRCFNLIDFLLKISNDTYLYFNFPELHIVILCFLVKWFLSRSRSMLFWFLIFHYKKLFSFSFSRIFFCWAFNFYYKFFKSDSSWKIFCCSYFHSFSNENQSSITLYLFLVHSPHELISIIN